MCDGDRSRGTPLTCAKGSRDLLASSVRKGSTVSCFWQKQFHSQIDELIEESVKDMIQLLVAKVISELKNRYVRLFLEQC